MTQKFSRRDLICLPLAALSVSAAAPAFARKQAAVPATPDELAWPTRPVKLLVGFPKGSTPDLTARTLAEPLSQALGQPVLVENRIGAGGNTAAAEVARASDQHTLGVMINGNLTIARLLDPKLAYDPEKDLAPISLIGTAPLMLVAPTQAPGANALDFFVAARNAGDRWRYGSPGVGTVGHLGMELIRTKTNISPVHKPFPGSPQVVAAMAKGDIQLALLPLGVAVPLVRQGKLRAIGVTSTAHSPLAPEFQSLDEQGVTRGLRLEVWTAMAAPATLPPAVVQRLSAVTSQVVRSALLREQLFKQGWQAVGSSAAELRHRMKQDTALLGGVMMMRGIQAG